MDKVYFSIKTMQDTVSGIHIITAPEPCDSQISKDAVRQLEEYMEGRRRVFTFPITLEGTDFQKRVWTELLKIPYGETRSYKDIASAIGCKSARAVGQAVGKNPLLIAVPCHRVITHDGKLGGFSAGLDVKRRLLAIEGIKYRE